MAQGFSVNVYGTVNQQPPYKASVDGTQLSALEAAYPASQVVALSNFPTTNVNIWPIQPGVLINGVYCYGVIEVPAGGLQQFTEKYVVKETTAVLATLRG